VEKSFDGENWARVRLVMKMGGWASKKVTYALPAMNKVPQSPFAIRSQVRPELCLGVKETFKPDDKEKENPMAIAEHADVQLQPCNEGKPSQFWLMKDGMLENALDNSYLFHPKSGAMKAGATGAQVKQCTDKTKCTEIKKAAGLKYEEGAKGGLIRSSASPNVIVSASKLAPNAAVKFLECGGGSDTAAISRCKENTQAQFELLPMFELQESKRAIACAPYSHSNLKPKEAQNRQEAQALCAANAKCEAYNWSEREPQGQGAQPFQVFLCEALHEVHPDTKGWELGIRVGLIERF